jgi:hypothetical protein
VTLLARVGEPTETKIYLADTLTGTPITDADPWFEVMLADAPAGGDFQALNLTNEGGGFYSYRFTPTVQGSYYLAVKYTLSSPDRTFEEDWIVSAALVSTATVVGDMGTTRKELRRAIADELGELLIVTATSASPSNLQFVDAINLVGPDNKHAGRRFMATAGTGANLLRERVVVASSRTGTSLELSLALPEIPQTGDEAELLNDKGQGWSFALIHRLINKNIRDSGSLHRAELMATLGIPFAASSYADATVTLPAEFREIYALEYLDDSSQWRTLDLQGPRDRGGYRVNGVGGVLTVSGNSVSSLVGKQLRAWGYGVPSILSADADVTSVSADWLVQRVVAQLLRIGSHFNRLGDTPQTSQAEIARADSMRPLLRTIPKPGSMKVR